MNIYLVLFIRSTFNISFLRGTLEIFLRNFGLGLQPRIFQFFLISLSPSSVLSSLGSRLKAGIGLWANKYGILNYFAYKAELDSCSITIQCPCNITTKFSNPWVYDYLLIWSGLFLFSLEPSRPTVPRRHSLFQPVEK